MFHVFIVLALVVSLAPRGAPPLERSAGQPPGAPTALSSGRRFARARTPAGGAARRRCCSSLSLPSAGSTFTESCPNSSSFRSPGSAGIRVGRPGFSKSRTGLPSARRHRGGVVSHRLAAAKTWHRLQRRLSARAAAHRFRRGHAGRARRGRAHLGALPRTRPARGHDLLAAKSRRRRSISCSRPRRSRKTSACSRTATRSRTISMRNWSRPSAGRSTGRATGARAPRGNRASGSSPRRARC